ncbi:hypothetical protein LTR62_002438 [Meristemomyces frigidus]|uniref:Uncharacterized protein n=1 Tax=Meristemomyces frigidus TaxID=1508187 RepID=A0AAN7YS70_9PEZI|nr:hypothetical protein LTR62_002438 [Meristemomyces frigidus]
MPLTRSKSVSRVQRPFAATDPVLARLSRRRAISKAQSTPVGRKNDIWYDLWRTDELRKALKDRTGQIPKVMERFCYVQQLVDLDNNWTFPRFSELPEELRLLVYAQCLQLRPAKATGLMVCSPSILRTCKSVSKAARDLLYSSIPITINIRSLTAQSTYHQYGTDTTTLDCCRIDVPALTLKDVPMNDISELWPQELRHVRSVEVVLDLVHRPVVINDRAPPDFRQLNHLFMFLVGLPELRNLSIQLHSLPEDLDDKILQSIFFPVSQLTQMKSSEPIEEECFPVDQPIHIENVRARRARTPSWQVLLQDLQDEHLQARSLFAADFLPSHPNPVDVISADEEVQSCLAAQDVYFDQAHYDNCVGALDALRAQLAM